MAFLFSNSISLVNKANKHINAPNFVQVASTVTSTRYFGVAISDTGKYIY